MAHGAHRRRSGLPPAISVGFIPVGLGPLWCPFLRRLGRGGMQAVLSLTVGRLVLRHSREQGAPLLVAA
jgi:hypothetical protein